MVEVMPPSMHRPNVGRTTSGQAPGVAKIRLKLLRMLGPRAKEGHPSSHLGGRASFRRFTACICSACCDATKGVRLELSAS